MIQKRHWTNQPAAHTHINWGHPLARGLVACWLFDRNSVLVPDLTRGGAELTKLSTTTLVGSGNVVGPYATRLVRGMYSLSGSTNRGLINTAPPSRLKITNSVLSVHYVGHSSVVAQTNNPALISLYYTNSNTTPFVAYGIHRVQASGPALFWLWNNGAAQSLQVNSLLTSGQAFDASLTMDGTTLTAYKDGLQVGSDGTNVGTISYGASPTLCVGRSILDNGADATVEMAGIWNRCLSSREIWELHMQPFDMFFAPTPGRGLLLNKVGRPPHVFGVVIG